MVALVTVALLGACGDGARQGEFYDPYEEQNRAVHAENKSLDKGLVRPVANGYGKYVPDPVRRSVSNFASNLSLPGMVVNDLLQFQLDDAISNTSRFLFNSTIGLAGLFDPASSIGITERSSDFGETMHVWGVGEGHYIELPLLGPSTERDTIGMVADLALNPLNYVLPGLEAGLATGASAASTLDKRYRFTDTVDSVLYESADSYAQARLLYLQNRRFTLGDTGAGADDPYADPYADPYDDPYFDPYED